MHFKVSLGQFKEEYVGHTLFFCPLNSFSNTIKDADVLALANVEMADICNCLLKKRTVSEKSKTAFRHYCVATLSWIHHQAPKSIMEFKVSL